MKQEHRSLLAIGLSALIMLLWFKFMVPQQKPADAQTQTESGAQAASQVSGENKSVPFMEESELYADPQAHLPVKVSEIKNNLYEAKLSTDGASIESWKILAYHETADKSSPHVDLVPQADKLRGSLNLSFLDANFEFPEKPHYRLTEASENKLVYTWSSRQAEVTKVIRFHDENYLADVDLIIKNKSSRVLDAKTAVSVEGLTVPKEKGTLAFLKQSSAENRHPLYYLDGEVHREAEIQELPQLQAKAGDLYWAGIEDRYFMSTLIPRDQAKDFSVRYGASSRNDLGEGIKVIESGIVFPRASIAPGASVQQSFSLYAGPKDINMLKAAGEAVRLNEAIDYGWFSVVAVPIVYALKFLVKVVRDFGLSIILLTVFIKLLLNPISKKSLKSMKAMQQLQPKLKKLQEKYKDDKAKLQQETMQLFRTHKVNPAGGCLPMLLQFPVYIALYKVLWNSMELYHAPFFIFYKDLAAPDPYFILPIFLGLFMVAQQKVMPSPSTDPAQKKMMMLMPVMFAGFMLFLPVGLVLYILVNTVMSVGQQWMYNNDIRLRDFFNGTVLSKLKKNAVKEV
ncbi:MAG: hypothetical protein COX62_07045 [Deltaproteobacteria bacterium CG_4_10_14_0_2_um_filter_43_8]|nr:MAG: hypothetical protein COV43_04190 [Deltaproteobacteria bacterium CG11_big_fil_rev_8_21_14_0_20_42_23]PJA19250.1 MAG: hypothetical protein COX62_07045 [Deltaproteobacteria bacterium CG_4_10_14_0_2_um_filter_43_8]PJC64125.1 MAG: hypothetical protein CO021_05895 [Deltaproteobacteria bacterium CG_4_9_14_0_2_um_filter_42_21]